MTEEQLPSPEEYDARIRATIPRYDSLLADSLDVAVHSGVDIRYWVDVGAGTGNMAIMAMSLVPIWCAAPPLPDVPEEQKM